VYDLATLAGNMYLCIYEYTGVRSSDSGGKYVSMKKSSQQGVPKNIYTIPYLMWAYNVSKCTFKRKLKESKQGYTVVITPKKHTGTSRLP
jgi:hypothetical protein